MQSEKAMLRHESSIDLTPSVTDRDHIQGPNDAPLTLLLYGDYECPYTRKSLPAVHALQQRLADQLRFVFRNFPLLTIHPHALRAAEAAEAAGAQGQFWVMHQELFRHQRELSDTSLHEYAQALGLDTTRFAQDMATHAHLDRVRADVESGIASGVEGTPTFFINGRRYLGSYELEALQAALKVEFERAER
jgi:protein-disulfide isomerase